MRYLLWVNEEAEAEIRQLPGNMRQRIRRVIQELRSQPRPVISIAMNAKVTLPIEVRRIRIDSWRIVYIIDEELSKVGILAVRKRPPYDYEDLNELLAPL